MQLFPIFEGSGQPLGSCGPFLGSQLTRIKHFSICFTDAGSPSQRSKIVLISILAEALSIAVDESGIYATSAGKESSRL